MGSGFGASVTGGIDRGMPATMGAQPMVGCSRRTYSKSDIVSKRCNAVQNVLGGDSKVTKNVVSRFSVSGSVRTTNHA